MSALSGAQHLAGSGRTSFPVDKALAARCLSRAGLPAMRRTRGAGRYPGAARRSDPPRAGLARSLAGRKARRRVRRPRLCRDAGDDLADRIGRRGFRLDPARARLSHGDAARRCRRSRRVVETPRRGGCAGRGCGEPVRSCGRGRPSRRSAAEASQAPPSDAAAPTVALAVGRAAETATRRSRRSRALTPQPPSNRCRQPAAIEAAPDAVERRSKPLRPRRQRGESKRAAAEVASRSTPAEAAPPTPRRQWRPPPTRRRASGSRRRARGRRRARTGRGLAARRPLGRAPAASRSQPSSPSRSPPPQARSAQPARRRRRSRRGRQARAASARTARPPQ